jgi:hypothetical protein
MRVVVHLLINQIDKHRFNSDRTEDSLLFYNGQITVCIKDNQSCLNGRCGAGNDDSPRTEQYRDC